MEREKRPLIIEQDLAYSRIKTSEVAVAYAKVFSGWPWFEVSRGDYCGKFYGKENLPGTPCPCGQETLTEAYPIEETTKYISGEILEPRATKAVVITSDFKLSGFGWGYELDGKEYIETKYSSEDARKLVSSLIEDKKYFYISEVGILPEFQGLGLGFRITNTLVYEGTKNMLPVLLRTNNESPMVKIAQKLGMKMVQGAQIGSPDPENPDRIVFIKSKIDIPSFSEYSSWFRTPNYFDDVRTPEEMKEKWYKYIENSYYEKYGQEKIETLRNPEDEE
ncbi:MAG TPA: hypothetical protein VKC53_03030 [Patescibacteria group bacterium]|nr:hypothetical protein [Patescibacteria group bacterium]